MIGYATLGTNDAPRAIAFYEEILKPLGVQTLFEVPRGGRYWTRGSGPFFGVVVPFDGAPASVGNGTMISLRVESQELVAAIHASALRLGGRDEGPPGDRGSGFYCGYFRDLDGNKLNVYHQG
jgi:catechol 2,3-dioxygenase-like lactoylglutathione lyase family enzyme